MKLPITLLTLFFFSTMSMGQYIGVKARYTDTRLIDDSPYPPRRENRLILSFFDVDPSGNYTPVSLTNYDIWIYKEGYQYGNPIGGILDSTGNNYPGYAYTAPIAVAYHNSYQMGWIDCSPAFATHYVVNGQTLDCGFINVSYWTINGSTGELNEQFTAPNVCLPYYTYPHPLAYAPGNVNFGWPYPATPPYNSYGYVCQGTSQFVVRGVIPPDSSLFPLPVGLDLLQVSYAGDSRVQLSWTNFTEADIDQYEIERSFDGQSFQTVAIVFPLHNSGGRADYAYKDQLEDPSTPVYYRVKAKEKSGAVSFSQVLRVRAKTDTLSTLSIYPNPATQPRVTVVMKNITPGIYQVSLLEASGRQHWLSSLNVRGSAYTGILELPPLAGGVYQLLLKHKDLSMFKTILLTR
jgi:hypothetical protein